MFRYESNLLRDGVAVVGAEVAVGSHGQDSTVVVTHPAGDGGDVHGAFNACGGEEGRSTGQANRRYI